MDRRLFLCLVLLLSTEAFAVPLPWKNCGKPTDVVHVQRLDASVWPPQNVGPTGPLFVTAKVDPDWGVIERLRAVLFPLNWVFELKDVPGQVKNGFVSLPASWLVNGSPPMRVDTKNLQNLPDLGPIQDDHLHDYLEGLPVPAGPFRNDDTFPFNDPNARPLVLSLAANIGSAIPFMTASFSVAYNGVSGFPLQPAAGGVYSFHLNVTEPSGQGVTCMDISEPLKFSDTTAGVVERVPFHRFETEDEQGELELTWSYGKKDEIISSAAMRPTVELQSCSRHSAVEKKVIKPSYDPELAVWTVWLSDDDVKSECAEVLIRSGLTGQVDGPFRVGEGWLR